MVKVRRDFNKVKPRSQMSEKEKEQDDIYNSDELIEKILNSKKVRYEILNEIIPEIPKQFSIATIYIDLDNFLENLYVPDVLDHITNMKMEKKFIISSNIVNMAAHFRNYFATRREMYTNIVFFYSTKKSKREIDILPEYRSNFYNKRFNSNSPNSDILNRLIKENLNLCEILSDYLPHIYFVNSKEINPCLVPFHFIRSQNKDEISIIYSNDKIQILNCLQNRNTFLLRNYHKNTSFSSQDDLVELFSKKENYRINPKLLPYVFSFSGYKKYLIKSACEGFAEIKACNFVQKMLDSNVISNIDYKDPSLFLDEIRNKVSPEQNHNLEQNISLFHFPSMYRKLTDKEILTAFTVKDLQDMKSLVDVNAEYYEKYPIHLEELMLGEEYESV